MDLDKLIPFKKKPTNCDWLVKGKYLMYRKIENIPVAFIKDDIVYIFLDNRIPKQILKLTKWILNNHDIEFYFTTPELSNPSGIENYHETVIKHYLFSYSQPHFFKSFYEIEFDIIKNMVDWCNKEGCSDIIKYCYDKINKSIQKNSYDYWTNSYIYHHKEEVREEFKTLYRDIQINQIL
jgi:hypothetical protein